MQRNQDSVQGPVFDYDDWETSMSWHEEISAGIKLLDGFARQNGCILTHGQLNQLGISNYFEISRDGKVIDFVLSGEFLADLPGTPSHRQHALEALSIFAKRLGNAYPNDFYSASGTPFSIKANWRISQHPSRDVVWLNVEVTDFRFPDLVAKTAVIIYLTLEEFDFKFAPFHRMAVVVGGIRDALDRSTIDFYSPGQHPKLLQEVTISEMPAKTRSTDDAVEQFLAAKIYWLGFKRGNKRTAVWIADPWDASYLGVATNELIRAAQVVQARGLIRLSDNEQFARAEDALIAAPPAHSASHGSPIGFAH